jgi:hypothetical protein
MALSLCRRGHFCPRRAVNYGFKLPSQGMQAEVFWCPPLQPVLAGYSAECKQLLLKSKSASPFFQSRNSRHMDYLQLMARTLSASYSNPTTLCISFVCQPTKTLICHGIYLLIVGRIYSEDDCLERIGVLIAPDNVFGPRNKDLSEFWLGYFNVVLLRKNLASKNGDRKQ